MNAKRLASLAGASCLALVAAAQAAPATAPQLQGEVGPYRIMQLEARVGAQVDTLRPGVYTIRIDDSSTTQSFVLRGPGVSRVLTSARFAGTRTTTVRLRRGSYTYYSSSAPGSMRGSFVVG
jgi:hypothetical protein